MLQAPISDRKTKAEASSKTAQYLPEYEQSSQSIGGIGRFSKREASPTRQSHSLQQRENLSALQKAYGNQAVLRMKGRSPAANPVQGGVLQRKCACGNSAGSSGSCTECQSKQEGILQTKLQIGEAGDRYEQEADRVADQVMAASVSVVSNVLPRIQRFTRQGSGESETMPASVDQTLASPGVSLDPLLQQDMEQRFGYDFSKVRVHFDAVAAQSAREVNANAYTSGYNIVFGVGQFAPETHEGRHLLAHELTHVVQQSAFPVNSVQELQTVPDNLYGETEANTVAIRIANNELVGQSFSKHPQIIQRQPKTGKCSNAAIKNCTDEDLLTAICIGEVGSIKDRDGKKGVMNVVMNRVSDGSFGGDIRAVATASGQFHGLANGIKNLNNPGFADCRSLAQEVITDPSTDPTAGAVFFDQSCAKPCEQYCTVYLGDGKTGAHYFARRATPDEKKDCQNKKTNPSGVNRFCCDNPKKRVYVLPLITIIGSTEETGEEEAQDTTP